MAPYIPSMSAGHLAILVLDARRVEQFQHRLAILVGDILRASLREIQLTHGLVEVGGYLL